MSNDVEVKENPDIAYIKRDDIGLVIAKGLAKTYKAQPQDPVDYLANWLLNFSNVKNESNNLLERKQKMQELKDRKDLEEQNLMRDKEEELKAEKERLSRIDDFKDKVNTAEDLSDLLQDFTLYLKEHTGATGVYIGKLIKPNKPIKDDDDDKAHEDSNATEIIQYIHASPDHEFLIEKTLTPQQGLTHEVFKPDEPKEEEDKEENKEGEGDAEPKEPEKPVPKHIFCAEVVRDKRIHYFRVPRLGSYLAVELKYNSCLDESAFDSAFDDFIECETKRQEQDKEKQEYDDKIEEDKEREGEDYKEPEETKEWPQVKEKLYETKERKFVVCLDTMGQDRAFTDSQREFVLDSIQSFSDTWTRIENNNLRGDIQKRLDTFKKDKDYFDGEAAHNLAAEEEKFIDDYYDGLDDPVDEESKNERNPLLKLQFLQHKLCSDEWKKEILEFKNYRVVKFPRFWQSFFYFLGYSREEICEEGTNKLFWKKAKNKLNDGVFEKMKTYTHVGPKDKEYKRYQLLNFIEHNMDGISIEDIEQYSYVLSRLYKWLTTLIEMRKEDITKRKETKEKEREERDQALEDHKEWASKRKTAMEEARTEFVTKQAEEEANKTQEAADDKDDGEGDNEKKEPEEKPVFNEEEFYRNYDQENIEPTIPPEIVEDIDNDFEVGKEGSS